MALKIILVDFIKAPDKSKILEHENVKVFARQFEKQLKKTLKEQLAFFDEVHALLLIGEGVSIDSMKDIKLTLEKEIKLNLEEFINQVEDLKNLHQILLGNVKDFNKQIKQRLEIK